MADKIKKFIKDNYKVLFIAIVLITIFQIELPYKIYTPGGMVDLTNRVYVENGYDSSGKFGMAYVSMVRGNIPFLLASLVIPDWDIVKQEELTLENETFEERFNADKILTQQSIDSAIISSYRLAGKDIILEKENVHITYIDKNAKTDLKLLDIVLEIDGKKIKNTEELKNIVTSHKEGDIIHLKVLRSEKEVDAMAEVYLLDGTPKIGISITITYEYDENPLSSIKMKTTESGPSGGLMMSLALYNSLVSEDITKGRTIIGTGTIDIDGNVGAIGGVRYKLIGAVKKKAEIFLVPEENYEEALEVKTEKNYDIRLISVKTLQEAIDALK